jgi:hypothetical protein
MAGKECYHCGLIVPEKDKKTHDCWTTTEENLTRDLPEDLLDAWFRIRETALAFGEQRVYASHKSIMFARKHCYFFVRPQQKRLEVCFFLGRAQRSPIIKQSHPSSKVKVAHMVHVTHRDEVESPLTDWLRESYEISEQLRTAPKSKSPRKKKPTRKPKSKKKATTRTGRRA